MKKFAFGKNWKNYVNHALDNDRLETALASLLTYLPEDKYKDSTFFDIGCGSGIFSLSALKLGASQVISFDVDADSIEASNDTRSKFGQNPSYGKWDIFHGDILEDELADKYRSQGDIVYSWGVLHHTGDMYRAIENALQFVKPGGYFITAIYNHAPSSEYWLKLKQYYVSTNSIMKKFMEYALFVYVGTRKAISKITHPNKPSTQRGMSIYYDVVDWIGGYPYEFARFDEIKDFVEARGFKLITAPTRMSSEPKSPLSRFTKYNTGNNEFVFRKTN